MKEHTHLGVYGLLMKDEKILLVNKSGGPYDGKLDLPGGSFRFGETPDDALKREFLEEVGINVLDYSLYDFDSVKARWCSEHDDFVVHHIGSFYIINKYDGQIKEKIELNSNNDDSLGANFYNIKDLTKDNLSLIAINEFKKLGFNIN